MTNINRKMDSSCFNVNIIWPYYIVEPLYNMNLFLTWLIWTSYYIHHDNDKRRIISDYDITKNMPYLGLTGKLWSVFCEYLLKKMLVL